MSESRKNNTLTLAVFLLLVSGAAVFVAVVLFVRARQYADVENASLAVIRQAAEQERRDNAESMSRLQVELDAAMARISVAEEARAEAEKRAELRKNQDAPLRQKAADLYREKTAAEKTALDARQELAAAMARLKREEAEHKAQLENERAKHKAGLENESARNKAALENERARHAAQLANEIKKHQAQLQANTAKFNTQLAAANAVADGLKVKVAAAEKNLSELQAEIAKLHEQIKALQTKPAAQVAAPAVTK